MNTKNLIIALLLASGLSGCSTLREKPQLLGFALQNPLAAAASGTESPHATNLTSNAVRFSTRLGLDNSANGDGRGTEVNAVRHALWQAAIAARFGSRTAEEVGNAYERRAVLSDSLEYADRYSADEAVDLRNNAIGRRIGSQHPQHNMQQLTALLLAEYHQPGLWTASPHNSSDGRTVWRITQTTLSEEQYRQALEKLQTLDRNGMTAAERQALSEP